MVHRILPRRPASYPKSGSGRSVPLFTNNLNGMSDVRLAGFACLGLKASAYPIVCRLLHNRFFDLHVRRSNFELEACT